MKEKSVLKATFWYLICDFILRGMAFLTMPVFTRIMTVGQIGDFSILTSWISLFSVTVTLNLTSTVIIAKFDVGDKYDQYISSIAVLGGLAVMAVWVMVLPYSNMISQLLGMPQYAFQIMCFYLMFCQSSGLLLGKYRANIEYKRSVVLSLGTTLITTVGSLMCTIFFYDALKGRIYGFYIPSIIINAVVMAVIVSKGRSFKWEYCRYALSISLPLVIHNLAGNIMHSSDRIMIGKICSSEDAGIYGVAYTCAMFANILRNSLNTAWNPWIFSKINEGKETDIKKVSFVYLFLFFILCAGIILITPEILFVLGGEKYLEAKDVVPPVVTAYMFSMVYSLYGGIEQYYKKQKYFAVVATICALVNIGLNYLLLPVFGYIAAAYTTLISTGLECFMHFLNVKRMGYHKIYSTGFNLGILGAMLLFDMVSFILYRSDIVRWISILLCICVIALIAVKRKNEVRNFVMILKRN